MKVIRWSCEVCKKSELMGFKNSLKLNSFLEKLRKSHQGISPLCRNPVEELKMAIISIKMLTVKEVHDILIEDGLLAK